MAYSEPERDPLRRWELGAATPNGGATPHDPVALSTASMLWEPGGPCEATLPVWPAAKTWQPGQANAGLSRWLDDVLRSERMALAAEVETWLERRHRLLVAECSQYQGEPHAPVHQNKVAASCPSPMVVSKPQLSRHNSLIPKNMAALAAKNTAQFAVGQKVQWRDSAGYRLDKGCVGGPGLLGGDGWEVGYITNLNPLMVTVKDDADAEAFTCNDVRAIPTAAEMEADDAHGSQMISESTVSRGNSRRKTGANDDSIFSNKVNEEEEMVRSYLHRIVDSHAFEIAFAVLILTNTVVIAIQCQYRGFDTGRILQVPGYDEAKEDKWPGVDSYLMWLSWFFGIVFTLEVILKLAAKGTEFFCDAWNVFDFLVVSGWVFEAVAGDLIKIPIDTMLLRVIRIARLVRIVRLLKMFQGIDPLILMVTTIKGSWVVLFWAFLVLLLGQTLCAFLVNQTLVSYYFDSESKDIVHRRLVFKYFGTFTRSLFSMFELTLGNWVPIARILSDHVNEWFMVLSLMHKLTMGFAAIGVINGIFVQETFKVAQGDDTIMLMQKERQIKVHTKKMKQLFEAADDSGDGLLSQDEFRGIMGNAQVRNWMAAQEVDASDADRLFHLLVTDTSEDATLSAAELVQGMQQLKGAARSIDLKMLIKHHGVLEQQMDQLYEHARAVNPDMQVLPDIAKLPAADMGLQEPAAKDVAEGGMLKPGDVAIL